jgi:hypothetical protein
MSFLLIGLILVCVILFGVAVGLGIIAWRQNTARPVPAVFGTEFSRTQPVRLLKRRTFSQSPSMALTRVMVMCTGSLLAAAFLAVAANRGNSDLQILEVVGYSRLARLPQRVVQVDLARYQSFSQYAPQIVSSQAGNFGPNACGLITPAQAAVLVDNPDLGGTPRGFDTIFTLMSEIRAKAVRADGLPAYQGATGIQPGDLVRALHASSLNSNWQISAQNSWTLAELYQSLLDERVVIVDIQLQQGNEVPSTQPDTIAHYARVLGMDIDRREIYIENTLDQKDGRSYWTLPLADFMATWQYPETSVTLKPSQADPSIHEEPVTRWALVMTRR